MAEPGPDTGPVQNAMGIEVVEPQPGDLRCCCGRPDCVFLRHNCSVLSSVERDVRTAARMGQTLLARHEAYMASAERDRLELTVRIEQLERENVQLEAKNKSVADENHNLREELDQLNVTIKDAETKIELLEATLRDSQREVRGLENAEERAVNLERQIAILEEEQVVLRTNIARTEEESRTTMYRWRQAEKGLSDLQEQLERMEKEAREERERHIEVIGRMERQRAMERELNTAAGRLKGAAAVKSMTDSRNGGNVVSHFVRDLLQDNANLQLGIAELREMLLSSNDEIQSLREQLVYHQPAVNHESGPPPTLQAELEAREPPTPPQAPRVSQELHIHHHYHVAQKPDTRRPRKRRQGLTPGTFTPHQISAPESPIASSARWQNAALVGPLLSPTPKEAGMPSTTRWSLQSQNQAGFVASSAPSSPRSANRDSVFDRVPDLPSSPRSPATSIDPASPGWKSAHRKKVSELSLRGISETAMFPADTSHMSAPIYTPRSHARTGYIMDSHLTPDNNITSPYTTDDIPSIASPSLPDYPDFDSTTTDAEEEALFLPTQSQADSMPDQRRHPSSLRRVVSHESIMSLSNGLDIHTLKARPSQLALRPLGLTAAGTNLSAVTAQPTLLSGSAGGKSGSVSLRDSMALFTPGTKAIAERRGGGGADKRVVSSPCPARETRTETGRWKERDVGRGFARAPSKLGRLVGWRPWGVASNHGGTDGDGDAAAAGGGGDSPETSPSSTPVLSPSTPSSAAAIPALLLPAGQTTAMTGSSMLSRSPHGSMASSSSTATTVATATSNATLSAVFRAPGINQPGVVPGFHEYWAVHQRQAPPSKVSVERGDQAGVQEALREILGEG